ncbi:MAG: flagellar FlbD family protein [Oscillospiraceae bacterium]|nr:flagellar FlbD family protein [Oscillospiraceae bacterium]
MVELTDISGKFFILNCGLIETIESIPETKINLTNGKYLLVSDTSEEVVEKIVEYNRKIYGPVKEIRVINDDVMTL